MKNIKNAKFLYLPIVLWLSFVVWWLLINVYAFADRDNFADSYSVVAFAGGIAGMMAAARWGLFKSKFGSALGYFSLGLISQFLGFLIYTLYFRIGGIELAFPNVGDIPLLLASFFYILGAYRLLKVIVIKSSIFKPFSVLAISILATIGLLWLSWVSFLNVGISDERGLIYALLNVAYPLIQAFYFLLGIVAVLQARRISGGVMLKPVIVLLLALIILYLGDFYFLYASYHETWEPASISDFIYLNGFGLMSLAMLLIDKSRGALSNK